MIFKQVILSRLLDCHLLHPNSDQTSLQLDILEHRQCISSNIFQGLVLFVHFESDFGISRGRNTSSVIDVISGISLGNRSQLKNPDISGAIFTLSMSIRMLNSQCVEEFSNP